MKGWYIGERGDEKYLICKCCGRHQDVPFDVCPDCHAGAKDSNNGKSEGEEE